MGRVTAGLNEEPNQNLKRQVMVCGHHAPPCDFYLWATIHQDVYRSTHHTTEEPQANTRKDVHHIFQELQQITINFSWKRQDCVRYSRKYFQHWLFLGYV
jgi:hypothetical protein